jgi:hypothetical protein
VISTFFQFFGGEVRPCPLGTSATIRPVVLAPDNEECGAIGEKIIDKKRKKQSPWSLVSKRTIPTERPPLVGEI